MCKARVSADMQKLQRTLLKAQTDPYQGPSRQTHRHHTGRYIYVLVRL